MSRKDIRITAVNKSPEDRYVRLYVLALLELARVMVEEKRQPANQPPVPEQEAASG